MTASKEKNYRKTISFLSLVCVVFVAATVYFASGVQEYRERERLVTERAISSLCESLDSITVSLSKGVYTGEADALEKIGNELCRQASAAKESLGQLELEGEICDEIYRFLSQVGNYTVFVSADNNFANSENVDALKALSEYAAKLSEGMNAICLDYYNGDVSVQKASENLSLDGETLPDGFYDRVYDAAQTMTDYPTLIYDGPFADSLSSKKSEFLEAEKEITVKEAQQRAAEILGVSYGSLRREQDIDSSIGLYCFSYEGKDITVTKKGGYLCSLISDTFATEESISEKEAIRRGLEYLEKLGYENMTSSYYSVYDGVCTINYAYEENGVIFYGDLIKVSIGLDTGKLTGFDARNYLLNHKERSLPENRLAPKNALKNVSGALTVTDSRLAVIPLETGKEAFCYELHCKDSENRELLVYINAVTGKQEDILLLLYSDNGILTK